MDLFSSFLVVAPTASAGEADECPRPAPASTPIAKTLADVRRGLQGPPTDILAFVISALTSPFLVCTAVGAALGAKLASSWLQVAVWGALTAVFAGLVPLAVAFLMMWRGRISDIHIAQREGRWIPLGAAALSGVMALVALSLLKAPHELRGLGAAYLVNAIGFGLVSLRWKVSVHSGVYCGAMAGCALVLGPWWLVGLAVAPLVIWARARRLRHTTLQGIVGAGLATALTVLTYVLTVGL